MHQQAEPAASQQNHFRSLKPPWRKIAPCGFSQHSLAALAVCGRLAAAEVLQRTTEEPFNWTAPTVVLAVLLFLAAGLCEIGGGWLVWQVCDSSASVQQSLS